MREGFMQAQNEAIVGTTLHPERRISLRSFLMASFCHFQDANAR